VGRGRESSRLHQHHSRVLLLLLLFVQRDIVYYSITGQLNQTGAPPVEITLSVTQSAAVRCALFLMHDTPRMRGVLGQILSHAVPSRIKLSHPTVFYRRRYRNGGVTRSTRRRSS